MNYPSGQIPHTGCPKPLPRSQATKTLPHTMESSFSPLAALTAYPIVPSAGSPLSPMNLSPAIPRKRRSAPTHNYPHMGWNNLAHIALITANSPPSTIPVIPPNPTTHASDHDQTPFPTRTPSFTTMQSPTATGEYRAAPPPYFLIHADCGKSQSESSHRNTLKLLKVSMEIEPYFA